MSQSISRARPLAITAAVVLGGLSLSACATRGYVDEQIAGVNGRVSALETRVQDVSARADAAQRTAQTAATDAQSANQRYDQMSGRMDRMEQMPARTPRN